MKRSGVILVGLFGLFVGVGFILPALARFCALARLLDSMAMPGSIVVVCTLGVVIVLVGGYITVFGLRKR